MKRLFRIAALIVLISLLAACGKTAETPVPTEAANGNEAPATTEAPVQAPTEAPLTANEQWAKDNGVGPYQPATEDWAAIEEAAKKEGSVCVYSNSSKIEKLIDPWNALYPDIKLDCGDTDSIALKMQAEQEAGNVVGDVWFNSDGHILFGLFKPNEWAWWYIPEGVVVTDATPERPYAMQRHSIDVWGYNQEIHPEGCPLTNWWQLTEPALAGKVFMENPLVDPSTNAKITLIVEHADEMAQAYKDLYGKEWTEDEMAGPDAFGVAPENAGYLFLRKLARNQPVLEPGGDEVDEAYASLGMDPTIEPGYGLTGWDSYETTLDGELAMAPCLTIEPAVGIKKNSYLAIANGAPHPNAAKLFIKFALSAEGTDPWNKIGIYPGVQSNPLAEGMPPLGTYKLWPSDDAFAWANNSKIRDFFATELLSGD